MQIPLMRLDIVPKPVLVGYRFERLNGSSKWRRPLPAMKEPDVPKTTRPIWYAYA
jgi:hypothetical protein